MADDESVTPATKGSPLTSPYPGLTRALAVPNGHAGRRGRRHWTSVTAEYCQPDAARFGGAAVHPHRVLEAPVRPGRGAWQHSSGHRGVGLAQIHIPHCPHGLHTHAHTQRSWTKSRCRNTDNQARRRRGGFSGASQSSSPGSNPSLSKKFNPTSSTSQPLAPVLRKSASLTHIQTLWESRGSRRQTPGQQMEECVWHRDQR